MSTVRLRNLKDQVIHLIIKRPMSYTAGGTKLTTTAQGIGKINQTEKRSAGSSTLSLMPKGQPKDSAEILRSEVTQDVIAKQKNGLIQIIEN